MPSNRKPYPILSALKREGDTFTLGALKLWMCGYSDIPPQVAANDNNPSVKPVEWETNRYELSAEDLIAAHKDGKYSAELHGESRRPQVRRTKRPMPPADTVDAEQEMVRQLESFRMRAWLGDGAEILDMATGPYTYRDVAGHVGVTGSNRTLESAGKDEVKYSAQVFWRAAS